MTAKKTTKSATTAQKQRPSKSPTKKAKPAKATQKTPAKPGAKPKSVKPVAPKKGKTKPAAKSGSKTRTTQKTPAKPAAKKRPKPTTAKPAAKKPVKKAKPPSKKQAKTKKPTKAEDAKKQAERTLEEELEEQLTDEEIENFQIEKTDMEKLINKVSEIIATFELDGILQNDLWRKLKLSGRNGSRLALKLERMGIITREKILEHGRWTYKLLIKKTPISTRSIEDAPCLICPVEQKCVEDGETSPRNCQLIEDWVIASMKKPRKSQ